jgi:ABC-2 type transport system permease protein
MTATTTPAAGSVPAAAPTRIGAAPLRSAASAARVALGALLLRDLNVLRKHLVEFVLRTLIQPFLLVFVFLYVFPQIGQSVGGGSAGSASFATVLVPGVVGISVMFQGVQAVALQMAQEFGFTREIEDRVQAPCPVSLVALAKILFGMIQGILAAAIVFPIAAVVHARGVHADFNVHWWVVLTLLPLVCLAFSSLGLLLGCVFEPITFLGGTYYQWTRLAPVELGGWHWLQTLTCLNPLLYANEGMRAAFTDVSHMHLYVIYPVLVAFCAAFLAVGLRAFRRRVLS